MTTLIPIEELIDLLTDEEVDRMERRAWTTATSAWTRYQQSLWRDDPLATTNLLNSAAWSAENAWRLLYDESQSRKGHRHAAC